MPLAEMPLATRDRATLAALFMAAVALRAPFVVRYDEDIDSLRFALAVDRFDVAELRPHAPYYPVYIAAAKLVAALGPSREIALGIVGALAGAIVVVATALLAFEAAGRRAGYVAGALALASPFAWLSSVKLTSDMTGAAFTTTALWLCARARASERRGAPLDGPRALRTAAIVTLGLGLGARLSFFPFALACAALSARADRARLAWAARARDLAFGVISWLAPLVATTPPRTLVVTTWQQATGHFTRWGGSIVTVPSPSARLSGLTWGLWANVLGGAWPDAPEVRWLGLVPLLALLVAGLWRGRRLFSEQPEIAASAGLYLAWVAVGQNVADKPRHLLPLLPIFVVVLAVGADAWLERARAALVGVAALVVTNLADGAQLVDAHRAPSPAAAIVAELAKPGPELVVTRELARMIQEGAPSRAVWLSPTDGDVASAVDAAGEADVLITSEALSSATKLALEARGRRIELAFARPRSRYVDSLWYELALLRVTRAR